MNELDNIKQWVVRFISISGFIILIAYIIYGRSIFILTYSTSQLFQSGITIGLSFATFRDKKYREGIASLILWYIILYGISPVRHWWVLILSATYISVIALAVYYSIDINRKLFINNQFLRVATSTVLLGIANSLIIVVLNIYTFWKIKHNLPYIPEFMFLNLKYGTMLGLFMGIGIEIFDRFIHPKIFNNAVAS
jgi:hypothetical protein